MSFIFPQIVSIVSPSRKPEIVEESSSDSDLPEDEFPLSDLIPARQAQQSAQKSSIEGLIDQAIHTLDKTNTVSFLKFDDFVTWVSGKEQKALTIWLKTKTKQRNWHA